MRQILRFWHLHVKHIRLTQDVFYGVRRCMGIDITIHPCYTTDMMPHPELLLPDDEHYYFGVELPWSPEEVRERLLRKPEFLYSVTTGDEEVEEEYWTSWLYLWRCNEGWDMRIGHLPAREQIAQMHARHNMGLHVVLHALTEDEALNPATYSDREPIRYILVEPSSAEGCQTIPRLNLLRATGNTEATRFHVIRSAAFTDFFKEEKLESYVPEEVPKEVINRHCLMYARRALTALKAIHDADSLELLLPIQNEYACFSCNLEVRSCFPEEMNLEMQRIKEQMWQLENALLLKPWYAGCHHQRHTHPSGLVLCTTYPPLGEYRRELLDFHPGRQLCYKESEGRVQILPAGEGDTPMPQREGGRYHILPEDCICGQYRDEHDRPICWGLR